jgi:hypothetical protein
MDEPRFFIRLGIARPNWRVNVSEGNVAESGVVSGRLAFRRLDFFTQRRIPKVRLEEFYRRR